MKQFFYPIVILSVLIGSVLIIPKEANAQKKEVKTLPLDIPPFKEEIGRTYKDSEMAWPVSPSPPVDASVPARFGIDTSGIGEDTGSPVTKNYKAPFVYQGKIVEVNINLK